MEPTRRIWALFWLSTVFMYSVGDEYDAESLSESVMPRNEESLRVYLLLPLTTLVPSNPSVILVAVGVEVSELDSVDSVVAGVWQVGVDEEHWALRFFWLKY